MQTNMFSSSSWMILSVVFATCLFPKFAFSSSEFCHVPPSLWCSSPETIAACKVEQQCNNWKKRTELVNFTLYYESLCPDCQSFIVGELQKAFKQVGPIMNLELVPYGNAEEMKTSKGWIFKCQHGPRECVLNQIETCAIKKLRNATHFMPFIHGLENCLMQEGDDLKCVRTMCQKFNLNYDDLLACANGPAGMKYEHEMAVKTEALNPPNEYVPWVVLNGVHTEDIETKALSDLVSLICETYQGPDKSRWCPTISVKNCEKTQISDSLSYN